MTYRFEAGCLLLLSSFIFCSEVAGSTREQLHKLFALDGSAGDVFSHGVAIDSGIAIVGSPFDDDMAEDAGAAYLFDVATGQMIRKLFAPNAEERGQFGRNVSIDGNLAIASSVEWESPELIKQGVVHVFDVTTGNRLVTLATTDETGRYSFGESIDIYGEVALVGAPAYSGEVDVGGAAFLFNARTGAELGTLTAGDPDAYDQFGTSVAISGNQAIIGAPSDDENGINSGAAYLFDVSSQEQIDKLVAQNGVAGDGFGYRVDIDGGTSVVGAPGARRNERGTEFYGTAYIFNNATGRQVAELETDDRKYLDEFGRALAIDDNVVILGVELASGIANRSGAAYLFDAITGAQVTKLIAGDGLPYDVFGSSTAIGDGFAVVGARGRDDYGSSSGAAYLFDATRPNADVPGDFNDDGIVNLADYTFWRNNLGATGAGLPADGNGDSVVDAADYAVWKDHFGQLAASNTIANQIPEPATGILAILLLAALMGRPLRA